MKENKNTIEPEKSERSLLLKNGLIVDGTGQKGFHGDLFIMGPRIEQVSENPIEWEGPTIDCTGLVIAPGFIDAHSHMDRTLAYNGHEDLKTPFTAQGCTTFVAGNCGRKNAGSLRRDNPYLSQVTLFDQFPQPVSWDSMGGYFSYLERIGLSHNLVMLAGHGTEWTTLRGYKSNPLTTDEKQVIFRRLEEAVDQGAAGVSFGLQYEPDIFCPLEQIKEVGRLLKQKNKVMTVHGRAYSKISGVYKDRETPHNVLALKEMIDVARETGMRLQYSHLMFAGTKSFPSYEQCLEIIEKAVSEGVDVMTDTYPYHCGYSVINVILPAWFLADIPANYHDPEAVERTERGLNRMPNYIGFGFDDIQIMYADHPDLRKYDGWFLSDIAKDLGLSPGKATLLLSEKTNGRTHILNHHYSDMKIIDALISHPSCLFMTDSTVSPFGLQNPASFGSFPLVLQYARDRKLISLEGVVRKMSGATAKRFNLKDRGFLKKGYAADITVFDWQKVKDNNTVTKTDQDPSGIEAVFINGRQVKKDGQVDPSIKAGEVIRL